MPLHTSQPRTETNVTQAQEVAYRGVTKTFTFGFWQDDDRTIPITPSDASSYPRVQVYDPDGEVYLTATPPSVRSASEAGYWAYDFHVPGDADLTGIGEFWEFAAEVVSASGRHEVYRTTFSIHDPTVVKATNSERFYSTVTGKGFRVMYRSVVQLYKVSLSIPQGTSEDSFVLENASKGSGPYDVKEVRAEDGVFVYYLDIPYTRVRGFTNMSFSEGTWQAHWSVQESASSHPETVYQIIEVFNRAILNYVPDVRFVIDKLEKRADSKQSYKESDVLTAIRNGLRATNTVFPFTGWSLGSVPEPLKLYVILGAAYFAYIGQLGLAVDLQFNFSGQTTVLDQDQTGGIESMLERFRAALWEQLKEVKTDVLRHMRPVGVVATRPTRARHLYNTVFQVSSTNSQNIVNFLNSIGLI